MRYLRLWFSFLKMSAMADFEYRANIVLRVITEVVWYTMQLSVFEVLYTHTDSISGWTVQDMRVFMGTLFITDVTYMILFHENMDQIWSMVRKGDLDLYLVKPVNSQFMVSCRKVSVAYVFNWILVLAYLVWAVHAMDRPVGAWQILTFTVLAIFGVILCYVLRFMFSILTVVLQDAGNIQFVWHQVYRLATRPDPIYPQFLRYIVLTVFPVAFFASVPARVLVEGVYWPFLIVAPLMAIGGLVLSNYLWEKALRSYASASS
jgi:ABC-2 type transport system permease protein